MRRWSGIEAALFGAFLFWAAAGLISVAGGAQLARIHPPAALAGFIAACVRYGDPVLILLAFANLHLAAARAWGAPAARRWTLTVIVASLAIETLGVETGFPFGRYHYTDRFGPLLGVVPLVIPLAWQVVLTSALLLVRRCQWQPGRLNEAAQVGLAAMLYDLVLEPFATRVKGYWLWENGAVPWQNDASWFFIGAALAWLFAPRPRNFRAPAPDPRPWVVPAVTLLIFLAGRWAA